MTGINQRRATEGELWQPRFFDRALRTVREYHEKIEYIHLNPVRAGWVGHAGDWRWSSFNEYAGMRPEEQRQRCGLTIDRVKIPADPHTRFEHYLPLPFTTRDADRKSGGARYLLVVAKLRAALFCRDRPRDATGGIGRSVIGDKSSLERG